MYTTHSEKLRFEDVLKTFLKDVQLTSPYCIVLYECPNRHPEDVLYGRLEYVPILPYMQSQGTFPTEVFRAFLADVIRAYPYSLTYNSKGHVLPTS